MNTLDYIIVAAYAIGFLGLGYLFKEQKDGQDYFLGGKSFGWWPLGLSIMATQLSAISFIGFFVLMVLTSMGVRYLI